MTKQELLDLIESTARELSPLSIVASPEMVSGFRAGVQFRD